MNSKNNSVALMFTFSLMIMGMAGLPFEFFGADKPSPHIVTGLRLAFVGVLATAVGIITGYKNPLNIEFSRSDVKDWVFFLGLAVVGVNGSLTYALYFLDDRMAMAIMFAAMGTVFVGHHPHKWAAWLSAVFAVAGTTLLAMNSPADIEINFYGILFAAIGGTAQGFMFFKKKLMPQNVDPGIALGLSFLLGGLIFITVSVFIAPLGQPLITTPKLLAAILASALMTVAGWLILVYFYENMTGSQKIGAASLEPVGASIAQYLILGIPLLGEMFGVVFLVISAILAVYVPDQSGVQK